MFERFTEKSIKAIVNAQEEARRLGNNWVGTGQLLVGICLVPCQASKVLSGLGLTAAAARKAVAAIDGRGKGLVAEEIPFTNGAKRALELSWAAAKKCDSYDITTEHLLLGLLHDTLDTATNVLTDKCGSVESVRKELEGRMHRG